LERSLWQKAGENKYSAIRLVTACILAACLETVAQGVAGTSGAYLRPPMGAAAMAMGGACTAAPDYYAPWWNPAVLANLRDHRLAAGTGMRWLGTSMDGYGSFEFRIPPRVGMGLLALYRGNPSLGTLYDMDERPLPSASYTTMTIKIAGSYYCSRRISLGASVNVLYQSLPVPIYDAGGGFRYASATGIGGFDIAAVYRPSDVWTLGAVLKNLGAGMEWQMGDLAPLIEDRPLSNLTIGSRYEAVLAGKPLVWTLDCVGYAFGEVWQESGNVEAEFSTGAEWRRWDNFYVRAGIGDVPLNGSMFREGEHYSRQFGMRFTAGFSYDLSKRVRKGMWVNYAAATDKVWAGLDQQIDVTLAF
jgi:hypothetical protein